jgi:hypothetical protein
MVGPKEKADAELVNAAIDWLLNIVGSLSGEVVFGQWTR